MGGLECARGWTSYGFRLMGRQGDCIRSFGFEIYEIGVGMMVQYS